MFSWEIYEFFRSSHRSYFKKKAVLKNFTILTGKLQACNLIKNRLQRRGFPLNTYFEEHLLGQQLFLSWPFIKFRYVINRLQTIKSVTIQWKFINLCLLVKGWSMLHEKLNQDLATNFFKQKIHSCELISLFTF